MSLRTPLLVALALVGAALGAVALSSSPPGGPVSAAPGVVETDPVDVASAPGTERTAVAAVWSVRVVDEGGVPVPGVRIGVGKGPVAQSAVSDADGVAGFQRAFAGPTRAVTVDDPAFALVGPETLHVDDADGSTLVLRRQTPLAGRVVFDDTGDGVPGVELNASRRPGLRARTDAHGRFRLYGDAVPGATAELEIVDPGPCVGIATPSGPWWGRDDVVIRLPRARRVVVEAVAADTGAPLEGFAVRLRPLGLRTLDHGAIAGRGVDGRALVSGAWPGTNDLQVLPSDPRYAPSEVVAFTLRDDDPPAIQLAVAPRRAVTVEVRDSILRPVAGALVRWIDTRGRGVVRGTTAPEGEVPMRPRWRWRVAPRQVAEGRTDARGRVEMYVDTDAREQLVVVESEAGERVSASVAAVAALDGPVVVRVGARARIVVRLTPPVPPAWHPHVELRLRGSRSSARRVPVGADGVATFEDVPTGAFELVLRGSGLPAPRREQLVDITWLRNLVVAGGRDEEVVVDTASFRPSWLRGTVRGGAGVDGLGIELWDGRERLARAGVMDDGSFRLGPLWARRGVRLRLCAGERHEATRRWDPNGAFDLGWGEDASRDCVLGSATLDVILRDGQGATAPEGSWIRVRRDGDAATELGRADAAGRVRLERLVPGRYWLAAALAGSGGEHPLGMVELRAGRTEQRVLTVR